METISNIFNDIYQVINYQYCNDNKIYRPILYHKALDIEDGVLLYNVLTRELLLLSSEEYSAFIKGTPNQYLIKHWFLIPEDIDEKSLYYMFDQSYKAKYPRDRYGRFNLCTIFTTTECNARCPYCYEEGAKKKTMSNQVALDAAKYITERASNHVMLKWFGGEPLCNASVINTICGYLSVHDISYSSSIVSNGYLLDQYDMDIIKNVWRLKNVQITLDGPKDIYNKTKNFVNHDPNAFEKVQNNIRYLLDNDIRVNIRLNLSWENMDEMQTLVSELRDSYANYKKLYVYSMPLFDGTWNPVTPESRKVLHQKHLKLQDYIKSCGLGGSLRPLGVKRYYCMADDGRSTVILPDGNLTLCEHHYEDDFYGSIYDTKFDKEVLDSWYKRKEEIPECKNCFYYPACYRINKCPTIPVCDEAQRNYNDWHTKTVMKDTYDRYRKRKEETNT